MFPKMEKLVFVSLFYILLVTVFLPSSPPTPFPTPSAPTPRSSTPSVLFGKGQVSMSISKTWRVKEKLICEGAKVRINGLSNYRPFLRFPKF